MTRQEFFDRCVELGKQRPAAGVNNSLRDGIMIMGRLIDADLTERCRRRDLAYGRWIVMHYFQKQGLRAEQIGRALNVDRTSVIYGVKRMDAILADQYACDRDILDLYETFETIINETYET